jgi:hypothetical protein
MLLATNYLPSHPNSHLSTAVPTPSRLTIPVKPPTLISG